ncbi:MULTISPECIES: DUF7933 domain-containing protein [unclassified Marinovum]
MTFTISNNGTDGITDVAFSNTLPAGLNLVGVGTTDCFNATLTTADGGTDIALTDGQVGPGESCETAVIVTGSAVGEYELGSTQLFANGGVVAEASTFPQTLTIEAMLLDFEKTTSVSALRVGDELTLTYELTETGGGFQSVSWSETFPNQFVVSSPSNLRTTCGNVGSTTTTGNSISVQNVFLSANTSCLVEVRLTAADTGPVTLSNDYSYNNFSTTERASVFVDVAPLASDDFLLVKRFEGDVTAGQTVNLTFELINASPTDDAVDISFTDDLNAFLAGASISGPIPTGLCGGATISGNSNLSFSGGVVPMRDRCSFTVAVDIPANTAGGDYGNTTSAVTLNLGGNTIKDPATDTLTVIDANNAAPLLTKAYLTNPILPGESTTLEFTITNQSSTGVATDIEFTDALTNPSGMTPSLPAFGFCNGGAVGYDSFTGVATFSGMELAVSGSCTFSVGLAVDGNVPGGDYLNTTSEISATVGGVAVTGPAASDTLTVQSNADMRFSKAFASSTAAPGSLVELTFTIENLDSSTATAEGIAFSDDLNAFHFGSTFDSAVSNTCGGMATNGSGASVFDYAGGSLAPDSTCTITINVLLGAGEADVRNTTSELTATADGIAKTVPPASADLSVSNTMPLVVAMAITDNPATPGGTATLEFTLTNPNASDAASNAVFTLDVDANLPGLASISPDAADVCGAGSALSNVSGGTFLVFQNGSLAPGGSCTFSVTLDVPAGAAADDYPLATSSTSATIGGTNKASAPARTALQVEDLALTFAKAFDQDFAAPGDTMSLAFTLTNPTGQTIENLAFTDDLGAMLAGTTASVLPAAGSVCGTGTVSGTSVLSFSGGSLAPTESCSFSVTVQLPASGFDDSYTNTTSILTGDASGVEAFGPPASDSFLLRSGAGPIFTKTFLSSSTTATGTATMRIFIQNRDTERGIVELSFTDDLSGFVTGATASSGTGANVCGAGSNLSGASTLSFTGGRLPPSGTCSFDVDIAIPANAVAGNYTNTTSVLSADGIEVASAASDSVTIEPAPTFAKSFAPDTIGIGETSSLTLTIDNSASALAASALDFTDNLPAGMTVGTTPANSTCGGSVTAVAGTGTVALSGGTVSAGSICTVQVIVQPVASGDQINTTGDLTSSSGNSGNASDTLSVQPAPTAALTYLDNPVVEGAPATVQFLIGNSGSSLPATLAQVQIDLPAGLVIDTPSGASNTCGGTFTADPGSTTLSLSGGTVAAGGSCAFTAEVLTSADGDFVTTSGDLTTSRGNSGTATDTLTVSPADAPLFTAAFAPENVVQGATANLTFTINNNAALVGANALDFSAELPEGLTITAAEVSANTCGGTPTAAANGTTIQLTGGSVGASTSCAMTVGIQTSSSGTQTVTAGDLTSSQGNSGPTSADLEVDNAPTPTASMSFLPDVVSTTQTSALTFVIGNFTALVAANDVAFTLPLTGGMTVSDRGLLANSCNGTVVADAGTGSITLTGGTIPAGQGCAIEVEILTAAAAGTFDPVTGDVTSSLGNSGTITDRIVVEPQPVLSLAYLDDPVAQGAASTLQFTIDNSASSLGASNGAVSLTLDAALRVANVPALSNTCGGTLTADPGSDSVSITGATIAAGGLCTFSAEIRTSTPATFTSTTSVLMTSQGTSNLASDQLTVDPAPVPGFAMAFDPASVVQGATSSVTFTLDNASALVPANTAGFSLTLPAGLTVSAAVRLSNTCAGTTETVPGSDQIGLTNGEIAAGDICTFVVGVQTATAGTFNPLTSELSTSLGAAAPATAELEVTAAPEPGFAMAFDPASIVQGNLTTVSFTIDNTSALVAANDAGFALSLPAGVTVSAGLMDNTCGGSPVAVFGTDTIGLTDGVIAAGTSCTLEIGLQATSAGIFDPVTSDLITSLGNSSTATATLEVTPAPEPTFAMGFVPDTVEQGETSSVTFTIDNFAALVPANDALFSLTLPAGLTVSDLGLTANTCGGTPDAISGTDVIGLAGGTISAGERCIVEVGVQTSSAGTFNPLTGELTTTLGTSGPATAELTVTAAPEPSFAMVFDPASVVQGAPTSVRFTIDNALGLVDAETAGFSLTLPAGLTVSAAGLSENTCGGTPEAVDGTDVIGLIDGTIAARGSCSLAVGVDTSAPGTFNPVTSDLITSLGNSGTATAALEVTSAPAPGFTMAFDPAVIANGGTSAADFRIDNGAALVAADDLAFTLTLPAGLEVVSGAGATPCGGTVTATPGTADIAFSAGSLGAAAFCQISVQVRGTAVGNFTALTSDLTSTLGTSAPATSAIAVSPLPVLDLTYLSNPVVQGDVSTLQFTIDNTGSTLAASNADVSLALPGGLVLADPVDAANLCGGAFTANAGGTLINLSRANVAAGLSCTFSANVQSAGVGSFETISGDLTTSQGNSGSARDTLIVNGAEVPVFTLATDPSVLVQGAASLVTFTIDNSAAAVAADTLSVSLPLGGGVTVGPAGATAATCGGTVTATPGSSVITLANGIVAAGGICEIDVALATSTPGDVTLLTGDLTSNLGNSGPASAPLNMQPLASLSLAYLTSPIAQGGESALEIGIDNSASSLAATGATVIVDLPAPLQLAGDPMLTSTCGGSAVANPGGTSIALFDGVIAAGGTCTLSAQVLGTDVGDFVTTSGDLTTDQGNSGTASDTLRVQPADIPLFSMAFAPDSVEQGGTSVASFNISNGGALVAATDAAFTLNLPAALTVSAAGIVSNSCNGTLTATAGTGAIELSGGTVAAGGSCLIEVGILTSDAGTFDPVTGDLTTSLGNSATATATLTVIAAGLPTLAMSFDPASVEQGAPTTVRLAIDNATALVAAEALAVTLPLPAGLTVSSAGIVSDTCGGTLTADVGTASVDLSGGLIAAGGSCLIEVGIQTSDAGTFDPVTGDLTSSLGNSGPTTASLTVTAADAPALAMSFDPASLVQGETSTVRLAIDNATALVAAETLAVTLPLPAGLTVSAAGIVSSTCGGTLTADVGSASVDLSGGLIAAGGSCLIEVGIQTSDAGSFDPVTGDLTSSLGNSGPATANLRVIAAGLPSLALSFNPDSVVQGATTTVSLGIDNATALVAAEALAVTLPLPAGLSVAAAGVVTDTCGGTTTAPVGASSIALSGGTLAAGAACRISVAVQTTDAGTFDSMTGDLTSNLGNSGAASASLAVITAPVPTVALSFDPASVVQGATTVVRVDIGNAAALVGVSDLNVILPLANGLTVSTAALVSNSCGGAVAAPSGAASFSLAGGVLAAGASCAVEVGIQTSAAGDLNPTTGDLTSNLGNSGSATANLAVLAATPPGIAMSFDPSNFVQGATTTVRLAIDNSTSLVSADTLAVTLPLSGGLTVSSAQVVGNTCGGTVNAAAGAGSLSLADGSVAAGATCAIEVGIQSADAGNLLLDTGSLTSSLGDSGTARATVEITPAPLPGFAMAFDPASVVQGTTSTAVFTIDNSTAQVAAEALAFTLPLSAGLTVSTAEVVSNSCGGTLSALAAGSSLGLSGGTVPAGASCVIEVGIQTSDAGNPNLTTGDLTSSLGNSGAAAAAIEVLAAPAPGVAMAFTPASVVQGATSVVSLIIDNSASQVPAEALDVTLPLIGGLTVSSATLVSNTCAGSVTATAGAASLGLSSGTVAAGASCQVEVGVQTSASGSISPVSGDLTSSLGNSGTATATLAVTPAPAPTLTASFTPSTIQTRQTSVLSIQIDNGAALVAANGTSLTATLPAGVSYVVPGTPTGSAGCGGAVSLAQAGDTLTASVGTIAPGQQCLITATVGSDVVGTYTAAAGPAATSLGNTNAANPQLRVEQAPEGTLTIVQTTNEDGSFGFSSTTGALNFTIATSGGTGRFGPVFVAAGTHVIAQTPPDGQGTDAITCTDANSTGNASRRELTAVIEPGENVVCTFSSIATRQKTIDEINTFLKTRGTLILSSEPGAGRRFDRLNRGFGGATQLSYSNGDLQAFLPFSYDFKSAQSGNYSFSTSWRQMRMAAESLALAHGDTDGIGFVEDQRFDVWVEGTYKKFETAGNDDGHFAIGYVGADYLVNQDVLVGVMLQFDDAKLYGDNSKVSGQGWMAGPYVTARLGQHLYFDGRLAAGTSRNQISPFNTYTDDFDTTRWLANASLTGEIENGPWMIRPTASFSYYEETQDSYTDSLNVGIPSQTISIGEVKLGPTISGNFIDANGITYRPEFGLNAIYQHSETEGVTLTQDDATGADGWRGRLKAGLTVQGTNGGRVHFGGSYDGIGSDFESWGVEFMVEVPLR